MKLTEKQTFILAFVSTMVLKIFDSLFLPNTNFSLYNLVFNMIILVMLIKIIYLFISNLKVSTTKNNIGYIVLFVLCIIMLNVVNF